MIRSCILFISASEQILYSIVTRYPIMEQAHKAAINGLKKSIEQIEAQIEKLIKEDNGIKNSYDLLTSVPGIGHLTAVYMICYTNNFAGK